MRRVEIVSIYHRVTRTGRGVGRLLWRELRDYDTKAVLKKGRHHVTTLKRWADKAKWKLVKPKKR